MESIVADTNVVPTGMPSKVTVAPGTNPTPFTVIENAPVVNEDGLRDVMAGGGRAVPDAGAAPANEDGGGAVGAGRGRPVTDAVALAAGDDTLVARTVTAFGTGTEDGA